MFDYQLVFSDECVHPIHRLKLFFLKYIFFSTCIDGSKQVHIWGFPKKYTNWFKFCKPYNQSKLDFTSVGWVFVSLLLTRSEH